VADKILKRQQKKDQLTLVHVYTFVNTSFTVVGAGAVIRSGTATKRVR